MALSHNSSIFGAAPEGRQTLVKVEGIRLYSSVRTRPDGKPVATLAIENTNLTPIKLYSPELALTLLAKREQRDRFFAADGPSFALLTRQSFEVGSEPRWEGRGFAAEGKYGWTIGKENSLPHSFTLGSKETRHIDVQFDLPDGQYDFLCGYGGGVHGYKCVASNLLLSTLIRAKRELWTSHPDGGSGGRSNLLGLRSHCTAAVGAGGDQAGAVFARKKSATAAFGVSPRATERTRSA